MKFSEMATIEAGLIFETKGGVMVKTTGATATYPLTTCTPTRS